MTNVSSIADTMPATLDAILSDIVRLGNAPIGKKTIPALRALHAQVMDFADSLAPKGQGQEAIEDFEEVINQLTETADNLDESCDAHDIAEDEEARDEALESAADALLDLARALEESESVAQHIETTNEAVAARWSSELARLGSLSPHEGRPALDSLLAQARTPKESSILLSLAKAVLLQASK